MQINLRIRNMLMLAHLALLVWACWLGLLLLLGGQLVGRVWHPHFLPVTAALVLMLTAGLALAIGAGWRLARGPNRRQALCCLLLGLAPMLFLSSLIAFGVSMVSGHQTPLNLGTKFLATMAESIVDLVARFQYPQRTFGAKVVMISAPMDSALARAQVSAMDRHVRGLEARLGRTFSGRIHWVRGPLLGKQFGLNGLCSGSLPGEMHPDAEGLTRLDRHEMAHCVMSAFAPLVSFEPPTVLIEGWAKANMGLAPIDLSVRAWSEAERGNTPSLRELTGPEWYASHHIAVYDQGGPLVQFLLETYGPDRFLELYSTCRQASFSADCQRVLGKSLDQLEADVRMAIDRDRRGATPASRCLARLTLGPDVAPAAWRAFLDEYQAAAKHLLAPYEHVRQTVKLSWTTTPPEGEESGWTGLYELARSGAWRRLHCRLPDGEDAYLAHPDHSVEAHRQGPGDLWEIRVDPRLSPDRAYRRARSKCERNHPSGGLAAVLLQEAEDLANFVDISGVVVSKLDRVTENGQRLVRVRLENRVDQELSWRSYTIELMADDHYATRTFSYDKEDGSTFRGELSYDRHDGLPVLRASRLSGTRDDGSTNTVAVTVMAQTFGPIPESEFASERLLDGRSIRKVVSTHEPHAPTFEFTTTYTVLLVLGVVCMVGGLTIARYSRAGG
jgi:hypothetical protein